MFKIKGIDHVAVAVENIDEALDKWRQAFGIEGQDREIVAAQKTEVALLPFGSSSVELIQPKGNDGLAKFLENEVRACITSRWKSKASRLRLHYSSRSTCRSSTKRRVSELVATRSRSCIPERQAAFLLNSSNPCTSNDSVHQVVQVCRIKPKRSWCSRPFVIVSSIRA